MAYELKSFEDLLGTEGFSNQLLRNHFTLYHGYVNNTNKLSDVLSTMVREGMAGTPQYAELKRRFGWEWNGMRLHEYYFGNMIKGGRAIDKNSDLYKKIVKDFGSYENWEKDFKAIGMMRGIGWAMLYYDTAAGRLLNVWINEHDVGHLSGASPILIMDVFEHAFMIDYGVKKADYIESFFKAIDWKIDITMARNKLPLIFAER
ncbi:superoxide dismutase [Candidatus Methanoperedens nitroreducens]|uniref:superoxide dismutase n=1 Tax=Candidatus Methanoperedens nitratireducens TaxID=1392998 RepID=A0A062V7A0_9EURY|nr:Fe-Mn family superoxide dismutase [Candidatus Methanoperedens nitroreducens]KCZ73192.1 superoxide dismutase [Candidatus Methanoperedens nitroreducens]MDJ1422859.1 Fe-Mn family superoxide dismutase [Candidatus Methanoperedens sp.]